MEVAAAEDAEQVCEEHEGGRAEAEAEPEGEAEAEAEPGDGKKRRARRTKLEEHLHRTV